MQAPVALTSIPHFITAASPEELQRLCIKNNLQHAIVFKYFDIQEMKDGRWIAWFFHDLDFNSIVKSDLKRRVEKEGIS